MSDLELLEKVHMRIALCDSDEKLQSQLDKLLAPVLLRIASKDAAVRAKVMELLSHVSKVLKSRPAIQIPVGALLDQLADDKVEPAVKNFTQVYLGMGFPRLSDAARAPLLPKVVRAIRGRSASRQRGLLMMVLSAVQHVLPQAKAQAPEGTPVLTYLNLDDDATAAVVLGFFRDVMLLANAGKQPPTERLQEADAGATVSRKTVPVNAPAGLSHNAVEAIVGKTLSVPCLDSAAKVVAVKKAILEFVLTPGLWELEKIIPIAIAGFVDSDDKIAQMADTAVKHRIGTALLNTRDAVKHMFDLFLGTAEPEAKESQDEELYKQAQAARVTPLGSRARVQILGLLLRCPLAANSYPGCLQVFYASCQDAAASPRLQVMGMQFLHAILLHSSDKALAALGVVLLSTLQKMVNKPDVRPEMAQLIYPALGKLSRRCPALFRENTALITQLFGTVAGVDVARRSGALDALLLMKDALRNPTNPQVADAIVFLLEQHVAHKEPHCRLLAVQYAVALFPRSHMPSRFVCLRAIADDSVDIREEARRGINPVTADELKEKEDTDGWYNLPPFDVACKFVFDKVTRRIGAHAGTAPADAAVAVLPFFSPVYSQMLLFLRHTLGCSAGVHHSEAAHVKATSEVGKRLPAIGIYLQRLQGSNTGDGNGDGTTADATAAGDDADLSVVLKYQQLLERGTSAAASGALQADALTGLCELVASTGDVFAAQYAQRFRWLRTFVSSTREDTRVAACRLTGLVAAQLHTALLEAFFTELLASLKNAKEASPEALHGSLMAAGAVLGALNAASSSSAGLLSQDIRCQALTLLVEALGNKDEAIAITACKAIGEGSRGGSLPLPLGEEADQPTADKPSVDAAKPTADQPTADPLTKRALVRALLALATKSLRGDNYRVKEAAAAALGLLAVGEHPHPLGKAMVEGLCSLAPVKSMEVQFAVGTSLCCIAFGPLSSAAVDEWHPRQASAEALETADGVLIEHIVEHVFAKHVAHTAAAARQAAGVWLLSVLKHCGTHPAVQARLTQIQSVFTDLLAESDENTQDIASKGMGVVYELGDEAVRKELVQVLVGTLTEGRRGLSQRFAAGSDDTVFADGALGQTKDGSKLTTYKELCSLANDLNQPDLIYKFMHLASHNNLWNSRKGAAFGFGKIASQAREQLESHLPTLVPRLYRYQYDPNAGVRNAMTNIWKTVCPESTSAVERYLNEILEDLKANIVSKQWRQREACALALADVLRGRSWKELKPHIAQLLVVAFRVLDDIKESVREAGLNLCKRMGKIAIHLCESDSTEQRSEAIAVMLPILIDSGLLSQVDDVRALSLGVILEVAKKAGAALKPHVTALVGTLLEALSGLESPLLNYFSTRLDSSGETDYLDDARLAASRGSPLTTCLDDCVKYADEDVLPDLVPKLVDLMKRGLGPATKAGCARFAANLAKTQRDALQPFLSPILKAMLGAAASKSAPLRRDYGSALAEVCKAANVTTVGKVLVRVQKMYLGKDSVERVHASAVICKAISTKAQDVFRQHAAAILPMAFLGMHDPDSELKTVWGDVWGDNTGGTEGGVRLYLGEIVDLCLPVLDDRDWAQKKQAAQALCAMATHSAKDSLPPFAERLTAALLASLQGRTWDGKEAVVAALVAVASGCQTWLKEQASTLQAIVAAVVKECSKQKREYKLKVLPQFEKLVKDFPGSVSMDSAWELVQGFVSNSAQTGEGGDSDDDDGNGSGSKGEDRRGVAAARVQRREALQLASLGILRECWPQKDTDHEQTRALELVWPAVRDLLTTSTWKTRNAAVACTARLFERVDPTEKADAEHVPPEVTAMANEALPLLIACMQNTKYSATRKAAVEAVIALVDRALRPEASAAFRGAVQTLTASCGVLDHVKELRGDGSVPVRAVASTLETKLGLLAA
eukprot:m.146336 g.146336  ORF g.146336 m.146336 type:complete len:1908 (-) comp17250_c0_seq1:152-5875(-)